MTADEDERRRAFETLYRVTLPSIRSYARRRAPEDLAEDVVAQTYLTAWRRCDEAVAGGLPWLYRTARFTLANHHRTERRQLRVVQRVTSTTELFEADGTAVVDERSLVLDAIERLNEDEREILLLVYWEHLTVKAVAVVLDCRPGTAAVRLHRARRKLRDALSDPPGQQRLPVHPQPHTTEVPS
ncbi:sigma-70 family RNA polymerase sigma factor [Aeromicrobium sp.]|uniref:RNA polymerase sigma factor n=1 Tax=Aeromicrobium sp. TaxID=1871063 RepID=UPI0030C42EF0